jgi:hypothetical protein
LSFLLRFDSLCPRFLCSFLLLDFLSRSRSGDGDGLRRREDMILKRRRSQGNMDDYDAPLPTPRAGILRNALNAVVILLSPVVNTLCYALSSPLRLRNWACKMDATHTWPKPISDGFHGTSVQPLEPSGFYRTFWFGSRHTEMLSFPGTVTPTGCLRVVYVIPGNPGAVFFYEAYARSLWELYNRQVHVVVAGHVGHSRTANSDHNTLLSLSDQVHHHTRLVAAVTRDPVKLLNPNTPFPGAGLGVTASVALAGHSVGAHICLQVRGCIVWSVCPLC